MKYFTKKEIQKDLCLHMNVALNMIEMYEGQLEAFDKQYECDHAEVIENKSGSVVEDTDFRFSITCPKCSYSNYKYKREVE